MPVRHYLREECFQQEVAGPLHSLPVTVQHGETYPISMIGDILILLVSYGLINHKP